MKKFLAPIIALGLTAACSTDKVPLEGERIPVLQGKTALKADYKPEEVKIKLPKPQLNKAWAQKGGNAEHFMQHLQTASNLNEVWNSSFGEGASKRDFLIAEPIIAHKVIFAIDAEAVVSAFRLEDGKKIWKKRLKPLNKEDKTISLKGAGLAANGKVVYATTGFGGVFALDMISGNTIWRYDAHMPIRIAPTAGQDKIFAQTIDNELIALNANDGKEIWSQRVNVEATTLVGGAAPAYNADLDVVIAAFSNGEMRAFKATTGSPLWNDFLISKKRTNSLANINAIKANPVIAGDMVIAAGNDSVLAAFDLRTGGRVWEREIGTVNQPWVAGDYVFVATNHADLLALEKKTGKVVWSTNIPLAADMDDKNGVFVSGPVLTSNRLIVATSSGYAFAVSPYTGKILGFINMDEDVVLPPIVANEMVVFTSNDAELLAYK